MKLEDWVELMQLYNKRNKTYFVDLKTFLKTLYEEHKSMYPMEKILGVTRREIANKLKHFEIKVRERGWQEDDKTTVKYKILAIPSSRMKEMTLSEIAKEVGTFTNYVCEVLIKYNRSYKSRSSGRGAKKKILDIPEERMKEMSFKKIMYVSGASYSYVRKILKDNDRTCYSRGRGKDLTKRKRRVTKCQTT